MEEAPLPALCRQRNGQAELLRTVKTPHTKRLTVDAVHRGATVEQGYASLFHALEKSVSAMQQVRRVPSLT